MLHHGVEVSPTGFDAVRVFNEKGTDRFAIGVDVQDGYKFKVSLGGALGSNDFVTVTPAGDVGLGTTGPDHKLDIVGGIRLQGGARYIRLNNQGTEIVVVDVDGTGPTPTVRLYDGKVVIDSAGNVGVNDPTPSYPLEVVGVAPGKHVADFRNTHASGYTRIRMQTPDSRFMYVGIGNASAAGWVGRGHLITDPNTPISIGANYQANQLFLATGGEVGIWTEDPKEALDINHDAIRLRAPQTPATAGAAGTTGMICWSTGHLYVAVGTNEWERAALASW